MRHFILANSCFRRHCRRNPERACRYGRCRGRCGVVSWSPAQSVAVAGGVVGAVYGKPFWGPSISRGHCWTDNSFHRPAITGRRADLSSAPRDSGAGCFTLPYIRTPARCRFEP